MIIILMGVAGSGKSTLGQQLAQRLNWQFIEGDRCHPSVNIAKMSQGIPLTDTDRRPWLLALRGEIEHCLSAEIAAVITCSALKQQYRDLLKPAPTDAIQFVYLRGQPQTLRARLTQRPGHFMKVDMLASQLAALEEPSEAIVVDIEDGPAAMLNKIWASLSPSQKPLYGQ